MRLKRLSVLYYSCLFCSKVFFDSSLFSSLSPLIPLNQLSFLLWRLLPSSVWTIPELQKLIKQNPFLQLTSSLGVHISTCKRNKSHIGKVLLETHWGSYSTKERLEGSVIPTEEEWFQKAVHSNNLPLCSGIWRVDPEKYIFQGKKKEIKKNIISRVDSMNTVQSREKWLGKWSYILGIIREYNREYDCQSWENQITEALDLTNWGVWALLNIAWRATEGFRYS